MQNSPFQDDENQVEIVDLDTLDENTDKADSIDTSLSSRKAPRKKRDQRRVLLAIRIGLAALTLAGSLTLGLLIWPTVAPKFSAFNKPTAIAPTLTPRPNFNIASQVYFSHGITYIFSTNHSVAYVGSDPYNLSNFSLEAVRQSDGRVLWSFQEQNINVGQTPDRVFLGVGKLYLSSLNGLEALQASNGHILWQKTTAEHIIFVNNTTIYTDLSQGAGIVALRASDGQVLWQNNTVTYASANNAENTASQTLYAFQNGKNDLLSLNPLNGSILWRYHTPIGSSMLTSTNSEVNSFSNSVGSLFAPVANSDTTRWHYENISKIWITYDARLYALLPDRHVAAIDPLTGSVLWDQSSIGDILQIDAGILYTTPLTANGIDAHNINDGTLRWHDNVAIFPIIAQDGVLYVSTPRALAAFNATNGLQRWQISAVNIQILQIGDGNIYLQLADEDSMEIFNILNGKKLWSYTNYDSSDNGLYEQYGITCVASLSRGTVVARRSSNGSLLWTHVADFIRNHSSTITKVF